MKLLVTAFEPFDHQTNNSSLEILRLLPHRNLETKVLPVTYRGCVLELKKAIQESKPDIILCLGQAGGSSMIRVEKVALNYTRASIPDNDGVLLEKGEVIPGGKEAWFTDFDMESLVKELNQQIPTVVSLSAGGFICNSTYYTALTEMKGKALFVHLPYYEGQGEDLIPTMKKEEMVKAIEKVIQFLLQN